MAYIAAGWYDGFDPGAHANRAFLAGTANRAGAASAASVNAPATADKICAKCLGRTPPT